MKKLFTILAAVLLTTTLWAQSPEKMSYQAVIRNSSNALVCSQPIGMKISILQGSISGSEVYVELFHPNPTSNVNGLVSVEIGVGIPLIGSFAAIDWSAGPYFIKTETDPTGGTNYTITGTAQLLSVPYALHAKTAETVKTITETDPIFEVSVASSITATDTANWNKKYDNYTETDSIYLASQAANITATDISNLGNLSGTNTGDQDLSTLATKNDLRDSTTKVRSEIPNVSIYATTTNVNTALASKVDKVSGKGLSTVDFSKADSTKLAGISDTNTGNQDLSTLATKTALRDSTTKVNIALATKVDKVTGKGLSTVDYNKADSTKLAAISGTNTGDQDLSGLATKNALRDSITKANIALATKVDKVTGKGLSTVDYSKADSTKLAAISGTNTGDQDLSGLATKNALRDSTAKTNIALATKVDKVTDKGLSTVDYSKADSTKLAAISGTNTGDQDLSSLATKTQLSDSTAKVRSEIPNVSGFATTTNVNTGLATKVDKVTGKGLSTVDYSKADSTKLASINGSETKVTAGTNVTVTGSGTTASPYVVNENKPRFYLGQDTLGGIVFYIYIGSDAQQHGLIVSKTESTATWSGSTLVGANRTDDGAYNMNLMLTSAGTARTWVATLGTSWYLPSVDEINLLWHNRFHVNKAMRTGGNTLLSNTGSYWSSTEYNSTIAFYCFFSAGYTIASSKADTYSVRAVRAF